MYHIAGKFDEDCNLHLAVRRIAAKEDLQKMDDSHPQKAIHISLPQQ